MIKVGINGFGRIGRFVFRAAQKRNDIQIVGINDLCPVDYLAYMLKYDTMHGQFDGTIEADVENSKLIVNGNAIRVTAERNPADLKWDAIGAEYVVESTGLFLTKEKAQAHIEAGAKYVVMSAPSKDDTPMFVCGVNEKTYVKGTQFVSNASCTTNCLAPIAKVLNDKWGITDGYGNFRSIAIQFLCIFYGNIRKSRIFFRKLLLHCYINILDIREKIILS